MGRRFITVEDVRRAGGGEIVVDADTIVTPQALDAAQGAGDTIRTSGGAYVEPVPDRGPDAPPVAQGLPHVPESQKGEQETGVVITVVGRNRPGVLAEITGVLGQLNASVVDISQKTIDQYFHLVLTVEQGGPPFGELKQALESLGGEDDYVVRVMHERVFRFMHRI